MQPQSEGAPTPLITDALDRVADTAPDRPLMISGKQSFTYGRVRSYARQIAAALRSRGVQPGDRVIVCADAGDAWFAIFYLGIHFAGAVCVPLGEKVSDRTRESVVAQVAPACLLTKEMLQEFRKALRDIDRAPADAPCATRASDVADILFTSGTSGPPKGVMLTHANIMAAARSINEFVRNGEDDREVVTVPLSHSFGLGRLRCTLLAGGCLILVPGLSFPALAFRALEEHSATGLICVPAGAAILLKLDAKRLAGCQASLRYMELGSAPLALSLRRQLMEALPHTRLCMHYGLTEASRSAFIEFHADAHKLSSIGRPSPGVRIEIRESRIHIRSAAVTSGYWRDPERTRAALGADGWFDTGDLGHFDADGYLHFDGRQDDLINVGGRKVHPATVEEAASSHPAVKGAACIGAADPEGVVGEIPVLFIVPRDAPPDPLELIRFIAGQVESHAVPARVECIDSLPQTESGKLKRSELRERLRSVGHAGSWGPARPSPDELQG